MPAGKRFSINTASISCFWTAPTTTAPAYCRAFKNRRTGSAFLNPARSFFLFVAVLLIRKSDRTLFFLQCQSFVNRAGGIELSLHMTAQGVIRDAVALAQEKRQSVHPGEEEEGIVARPYGCFADFNIDR